MKICDNTGRYENRRDTIQSLMQDLIDIQKSIGKPLSLKEILDVAQKYSGYQLAFNSLVNWIETDFKANWITPKEYEDLIDRIEKLSDIHEIIRR